MNNKHQKTTLVYFCLIVIVVVIISIMMFYTNYFLEKVYICGDNVVCSEKFYGVVREKRTNKPVTGIVKKYYKNELLEFEGHFNDGKRSGLWIEYFEDGRVKNKGSYERNIKNGTWYYAYNIQDIYENKFFGENCTGNYINGALVGVWKCYYENGNLETEMIFDQGEKTGKWKSYNVEGQLIKEGIYENNKENGSFKTYYQDGKVSEIEYYKKGAKEGTWRTYYENGNLNTEINYENNLKNGLCKRYYIDNKLDTIGNYKDNTREDLWTKYHKNGKIKIETNYKNGRENGSYRIYDENGELFAEGLFVNGQQKQDSWKIYSKNGIEKKAPYIQQDLNLHLHHIDECTLDPFIFTLDI